jgi:phenylacetate-CoA ligase
MREAHFYDRDLETLDRGRLREIQEEKLCRLMRELAASGFYREKLRAAGIESSEVRRLGDITTLPFTTKSELAAEQLAHPPFGRLLTHPIRAIGAFHQTSAQPDLIDMSGH